MIRTALALLIILGLAACAKQVVPPSEVDACFEAVPRADGTFVFNRLSQHEPNMESCAGALEGMRQRFLGFGGSKHDIMGVYNAHYLFLGPGGVQMSESVDGMRFPFLERTSDGQLVAAGAIQTQ
jgi:hypothetical protein